MNPIFRTQYEFNHCTCSETTALTCLLNLNRRIVVLPCFGAAAGNIQKIEAMLKKGKLITGCKSAFDRELNCLYALRVQCFNDLYKELNIISKDAAQGMQEALEMAHFLLDEAYYYSPNNETLHRQSEKLKEAIGQLDVFVSRMTIDAMEKYQQEALAWTKRILFIENWLEHLKGESKKVRGDETAILKLLKDEKKEYLRGFVRQCTPALCCSAFSQYLSELSLNKKNPPAICTALQDKYTKTKDEVFKLERSLRGSHVSPRSLYARGLRGIDRTYYVSLARFFFQSLEDFSHEEPFKNHPLFSEKLPPVYIDAISRVGGALFLSMDLLGMRFLGPTYSFASTCLSEALLDPNRLIRWAERLGKDELFVSEHLQKIETVFHFAVFAGHNVMTAEELSLPLLVGSYVCAERCAALLSNRVSRVWGMDNPPTKPSPSYCFVQGLAQMIGFSGGAYLFNAAWNSVDRSVQRTN